MIHDVWRGVVSSLGLQSLRDVQAGAWRQQPAVLALMGLQQTVQLLEVGDDVVFDIRYGNLQANAAAVKGPCVVSSKHLADHARHHGDDLWIRGAMEP